MKDELKWKMGLRNNEDVNVSRLGLKFLNLNKNSLGNQAATLLASALKNEQYMRAISLCKNKIGPSGINELIAVTKLNKNLLKIDLRENSGFEK